MPFAGVTLLMLAAAVDADIGATAETRTGRAPLIGGQPPQNTTISAVIPVVGVEAKAHVAAARLQYSPRLSWVFTKGAPNSTYVLHQGALALQWRPAATATWTARAAAETGQTDYAALTQLLGRSQVAVPTVKGFTMFQGTLTGTQALARTWRFEVAGDAIRRIPLVTNTPPPTTGGPTYLFPDQTSLSLTPGLGHSITRQDTLVFRTGVTYASLSTGLELLTVAPQLGWTHIVDLTTSVQATLGVVHARRLHEDSNPMNLLGGQTPANDSSPIGGVGITTQLYGARGIKITGAYNAAVAWYLDPVLGASGAQGTTGLQLAMGLPPHWSVGLETFFSTSLRSAPLARAPDADETLLTAALPIRYRPERNIYLEFGGRAAARAPRIEASNFAFRRPELWAYVLIGATFGTGRGP